MKNLLFLCFMAVFIFSFTFFSCSKNEIGSFTNTENDNPKRNEATWISSNHSKGLDIKIKIFVGHTASECGGKCIKIFGEYGHADCRGFGNTCNLTTSAHFSNQNGAFVLILTDPNAFGAFLDFHFPDRSLFITNPQNSNELWLNIPEQLLIKDDEEDVFIIHDIWFSEEAELENL